MQQDAETVLLGRYRVEAQIEKVYQLFYVERKEIHQHFPTQVATNYINATVELPYFPLRLLCLLEENILKFCCFVPHIHLINSRWKVESVKRQGQISEDDWLNPSRLAGLSPLAKPLRAFLLATETQ